jgi:transcriptional regulator GlxA family with amidase domain
VAIQRVPASVLEIVARREGTIHRREALYEEAAAIIERDFDRELDLESVARQIATSRRQLQRAFAEVGDTSFRGFLAEVRMRNALRLLQDGSAPVREVAVSVGYRQPAQFAKAFRRHHGAPPSDFRGRDDDSSTAVAPAEQPLAA